jgi:hypothetical protein
MCVIGNSYIWAWGGPGRCWIGVITVSPLSPRAPESQAFYALPESARLLVE